MTVPGVWGSRSPAKPACSLFHIISAGKYRGREGGISKFPPTHTLDAASRRGGSVGHGGSAGVRAHGRASRSGRHFRLGDRYSVSRPGVSCNSGPCLTSPDISGCPTFWAAALPRGSNLTQQSDRDNRSLTRTKHIAVRVLVTIVLAESQRNGNIFNAGLGLIPIKNITT